MGDIYFLCSLDASYGWLYGLSTLVIRGVPMRDTFDFMKFIIEQVADGEDIPVIIHILLAGGWYPDREITDEEINTLALLSNIPDYFWVMLNYVKRPFNYIEDC